MRVIEKIIISTSVKVGMKYELIIDLIQKSITYRDGFESQESFSKIKDEQLEIAKAMVEKIQNLNREKYQGFITTNGYYWEFDLISDRKKMKEIEGINTIDKNVLEILNTFEDTFKKQLGVSVLSEFLK